MGTFGRRDDKMRLKNNGFAKQYQNTSAYCEGSQN